MNSDVWAPVVAALGASALTATVALSIDVRSSRKDERSARAARQQNAYSELLTRSALLVYTAGALRLTMQLRSGVKEGLDVTLRQRKPVDPIDISDRVRRDMEPLFATMSEIWIVGSQRTIQAANEIVEQATTVFGIATEVRDSRPSVVRALSGVKFTDEDNAAMAEEVRKLARMRTAFAELVRSEAGVEHAVLAEPSSSEGLGTSPS